MAGITLEVAQAKLELWLTAETSLATSQSYAIEVDGERRELRRADLADVRKSIDYWSAKVRDLERRAMGRSRTRYFVR